MNNDERGKRKIVNNNNSPRKIEVFKFILKVFFSPYKKPRT